MKRALPILLASLLGLPAATAFAQDSAAPPPPDAPPPPPAQPALRKRVVLGNSASAPAPVTNPILQRNYSLRLKLANGEQTSEFALLTASPTISFNGTAAGDVPGIVTFSGTLAEDEGEKLTLTYSVGGRIPFLTPTPKEPPPPGLARVVQSQIQYSDETSTGAIHVSLGKTHTLFKSGGRSYSITISAAEEPAE